MTNKIQKIREWVRTRKLCTMDEHMKFYCKEAESDYNLLCSIEKILDSIEKEPVSEDLDIAIGEYCSNPNNFVNWIGNHGETDDIQYIVKAIKFSANWQKQQMMAKAVDATVHIDAGGYPYIPQIELYDYDKDIPFAKEGDKYKVILIKEG